MSDCKHEAVIRSAGIKVCMDCGEPMNPKARKLAALKERARMGDVAAQISLMHMFAGASK